MLHPFKCAALAAVLALAGPAGAAPKAAPAAPAASAARSTAPAGAVPAQAREHVSMCIGCHSIPGYQASFPRVYRVPMIAGQSARYIEAALVAYRKGDRSHPTMTAVARGLTDAQMAAVAAYFAGLGQESAP